MSESLAVRAEILKLARLLDQEPAELDYMEPVPADDLRRLREQITDMLFTAHGNTLSRLAASSKLLPVGLVATIGQRAFGPVLSARVAGMLEPSRAVEMAAKLPLAFLADIAVHIDPRRASQVIGEIPPRQVADITRELTRREEYVTMGRFVGHLSTEATAAAVEAMDDEALLQVAFVLESKESLPELVALLPNDRPDQIIDAAAGANLWPQALDLLNNLSEEQRADFAQRTAERGDAVLDSLATAAQEFGLWNELLPLARLLPVESRERLAGQVGQLGLDDEAAQAIIAYGRSAKTDATGS